MRRVTFSRNFTLSLSRTCRCYCKYCSFATHSAHLYTPDEVERMLDDAVRRNTKELLVLTGERPEVNPEVAQRLHEYGHPDFTSYVVWACERGLERGLMPHTNLGVLPRADRTRAGLAAEEIEDLGETGGRRSRRPGGHPEDSAPQRPGRRATRRGESRMKATARSPPHVTKEAQK